LLRRAFNHKNVLFHNFDVNLIVEMDDILLICVVNVDLEVDILIVSDKTVQVGVFIDDIVEGYLKFRLNLANIVNCAHD
jgi:hypothetical protein